MPPRSFSRRALFGAAGFIIATLFCDTALHAVSWVSPLAAYQLSDPWSRNRVPDPVLGFRLSPYFPGHDRRGYRNEKAATSADVLAVGDSFTYGYAATAEHSWPRQLAALSGLTVYNAGVGAYGPCEYSGVIDELYPELHPRVVVVGIFLGNDLADAHKSVYEDHRCGRWKSGDPNVLARMAAADASGTMSDVARQLDDPHSRPRPRSSLSHYSALYGLARSAYHLLTDDAARPLRLTDNDAFESAARRPHRMAFQAVPEFRTVFIGPEVEGTAVDLRDPRVSEGWRITRAMIDSAHRALSARGSEFVVVIFHTKEFNYSDLVSEHQADIGPSYTQLVEAETALTKEVTSFLRKEGIAWLDTSAALRACFVRGAAPYPESDDVHLNAVGYGAVAEELRGMVRGPKRPPSRRSRFGETRRSLGGGG